MLHFSRGLIEQYSSKVDRRMFRLRRSIQRGICASKTNPTNGDFQHGELRRKPAFRETILKMMPCTCNCLSFGIVFQDSAWKLFRHEGSLLNGPCNVPSVCIRLQSKLLFLELSLV